MMLTAEENDLLCPNQDIAMWETMGPIADRTRERLDASDLAVVEFRRIMVEAARQMRNGGPAIGTTEPRIPHVQIRSFEGMLPKRTNLRTIVATETGPAKKGEQERVAWRDRTSRANLPIASSVKSEPQRGK